MFGQKYISNCTIELNDTRSQWFRCAIHIRACVAGTKSFQDLQHIIHPIVYSMHSKHLQQLRCPPAHVLQTTNGYVLRLNWSRLLNGIHPAWPSTK